MTTRDTAIDRATAYFDSGAFLADLSRRVAYPTESRPPADPTKLRAYLTDELAPAARRLGATTRIIDNPVPTAGPFLLARRHESDDLPTVLVYGHADVVPGQDDHWRTGLSPWHLVVEGDRLYGRGTADNKGQHTVNLAALEQVMAARGGTLGFNLKLLIETGEESGSPGLQEFCHRFKDDLAADVLIASDGPRLAADRPTLFLGSRGAANLRLSVPLRAGAHHSGNWGGALRNPATVLAAALATMVDAQGRILVEGLRPPAIPEPVKTALADLTVGGGEDDPAVDADWGEPGLTPAERVFAWNTLEVLALSAGDPAKPVGAIPGTAHADVQLRFVVGTDWRKLAETVRTHLDAHALPSSRSNSSKRSRPPASVPTPPGCAGPRPPSTAPPARPRPSSPTSAAPFPTTPSPTSWASPPSGSPTPTRPAPSTPPTNTCWARWPESLWPSWRACSGTSAKAQAV